MRINKNKSSKKLILTLVILVIVAAGTASAYAYYLNNRTSSDSTKTPQTELSADDPNYFAKPDTTPVPDIANTKGDPSNKIPVQSTPNSNDQNTPTPPSTITGSITSKNKTSTTLQIRVLIDQILSGGTCKLTLTNKSTGTTVVKSADILASPSSSTCKGFDIALSELKSGTYDITIAITSESQTGTITGNVGI